MHAVAFKDAVKVDIERARLRLIPYESREAPGSAALLPEGWRHFSISKAPWPLSIQ